MIKDLLHQLCTELDFPKIEDNQEKIYDLLINEKVSIKIMDKEKEIFFWSHLLECPKENVEDLYIYLMKANFLGQGTGGAVIGITADEKFLTLSYVIPYEINYQEFKNKVEDFVNYLVYWRGEIQKIQEQNKQNIY